MADDEVETLDVNLPFDEKLNDKIKELIADGWGVVPGCEPIVTMKLVRMQKPTPQVGSLVDLKLNIDDSKVAIIRGDKFIKADGTEVSLSEMPKEAQ